MSYQNNWEAKIDVLFANAEIERLNKALEVYRNLRTVYVAREGIYHDPTDEEMIDKGYMTQDDVLRHDNIELSLVKMENKRTKAYAYLKGREL